MQDQLLTLPEVCEMTKLSRASIYRLINTDAFPRHVKLGSRVSRWRASELAAWMEGLR